jgi:8-amino-7-oxononanoate synthase
VLDFTSALYLGLRHPSGSLRPWSQFTLGVPAALAAPPEAEPVAQQLAALQGCERGVLGPSTFHLFWDLFGMLSCHRVAVYVDAGTYPIARWGVERSAGRGVLVREFAHHDAEAFRRGLRHDGQRNLRPVVLSDGFCPVCGKAAPLAAYLEAVRARGGWMVVDDTQALGIFGRSPAPDAPYGRGGGGMLPRLNLGGPDVLVISSLAKAFGAPVAILSGSKEIVKEFELKSETRMHCSPPSLPAIRAAQQALAVNREFGDDLRLRLASLVHRFRQPAAQAGFLCSGDHFPVQTISLASDTDASNLHRHLLDRGVRTVLHRGHDGRALRLSFLISAQHTPAEIDLATTLLAEVRPAFSGLVMSNQREVNQHDR